MDFGLIGCPPKSMKSLSLLLLSLTAAQAEARPNFVFIFADDWGRHSSAYAKLDGKGTVNDVISTPNFDRIAEEGFLFRNAFVSSPSCTPSRSALLTGLHFWQTGSASILHSTWDEKLSPFPLELQQAGYHIGRSYKGWGPGKPYEAPFGGKETTYQQAGGSFSNFSQYVTKQVAKGVEVEEAKRVLYEEFKGNFVAFLKDRPAGEPFFYYTGPTNPHRKWIKGSGRNLWSIDSDRLEGILPPSLPDVPEIREDLADYLGEVSAVDAGIGMIYRHLLEIGELENTVIMISGDHGAPGFPYGKCNVYDFGARVPLAIRIGKNIGIPLEPAKVIDRLTSLIDLAPTVLELAGVEGKRKMSGVSWVPYFTDQKPAEAGEAVFMGRERHLTTAREGNLPYPQRAIRTQEHLLIVNFAPERWPMGDPRNISDETIPASDVLENDTRITLADEDAGPTKAWMVNNRNVPGVREFYDRAYGKRSEYELYDLKKDPHQVKNLAGEPGYSEVEAGLKKRLMDELVRTGDPRVTGDRQFYEKPPMAGSGTEE